MFRQRAAEVACFAFIAAVGVQLVASQTLTCYISSTACTSTSVSLTGTRTAGQCCLNRGGKSYRIGTSTTCTLCVVYGFFQSPNSTAPSTTVYQKEGSQLTGYFGFVNGTFSGTHSVSFSVPDNNRYIKSFTTGVLNSAATRQQFTLNIIPDNIALQPPLMVPVSATVDGSSEFVLPFNATILDADVVTIGFRESDYSVTEGASPPDQYPTIKLAKDKTIAQRLSIQVVPLTVDQFRPLGIPLPDGITFADLTNPAQYIPNGPMDFNKSIVNLTFTSSQTELSPNVGIVDDLINEAAQQFICIVRLADPSVNASGNVIIKPPSTVIRIVDNDPIAIGFGADTVVSEQTFSVTVIAQPNAVVNQAIYDKDYDIGPLSELMFTITPDQQSVSIGVNIYDAGLTGTLQAKLVSTQVVNTPSYSAPHNPTTILLILDNKVAIVGFVDRGAVVTEGKDFIECVAVTNPSPDLDIRLSFYIQVLLVPDTADASDVLTSSDPIILGPFDSTNRKYCFSTTALADEYFEGNQTFTYSLTLIGEQVPVVISPNVTKVTILDNTTLTIGFDPTQYAVNKSDSYVTFGVSILGGAAIQGASVGVMFSTGDGTALAGQDYNQTAQLLSFNENTIYIPVAVGIINNGYYDDKISFQANLALQSAAGYERFVTLRPAKATATIIDDINVPTVTLTSTTYMTQKGQPAQVCVTKDLATASDISGVITAYPIVASNAATPVVQFKNGSYPFTLVAGLRVTCVNITTYDDKVQADPKVFNVSIGPTSSTIGGAVTVGSPSTAQVTIIDNTVVPFSFVTNNVPVPKNANTTTVCLQKLGNSAQTISVTVYTTPVTALPAVDFTPVQQVLTFLPSDTVKCVSIPILDNGIAFTGNKTFKVGFNTSSPTVYPKGPTPESTVNIQDQSVVRVSFTAPLYVVQQSRGPATVCIVATPSAAVPITVAVVAGEDPVPSARAFTDFSAGSYALTIPANTPPQSPICTTISIADNQVALQPNKTFTVTLQPPNPRVVVSPPCQVLIVDNYVPTVTLTSTTYMTQKGQPAQVCVTKDLATASDISGVITAYPIVASNAATPVVQFKNGSYPFTLAAGLRATCVNITTYDDKVQADPKVFNVSIGPTSSTIGGAVTVGSPSTAQVTIIDNTVVPFSFVTNNVPVPKNANTTTVCLQKLANSAQTISVTVYTTPVTALPAVDFTPVQQVLTFLPSDTVKCVSIPILDNGIAFTGNKTFKVGFNTSSPTVYPKGPTPESTVNIQDQSVVRVSFTAPLYVVQQSQGQATVCIVATPSAAVPITVAVVAGEDPVPSARASTDFSAGSYALIIPTNTPPQSPICTTISIIDNQVALQPNKTFTVTLQPPNPRVVVSPPCQVLIVDNYVPTVTLTSTTYMTQKGQPAQVCVTKDLATASDISGVITANSIVASNAATPVVKFKNGSYPFTLAAGLRVTCVNITTYDDKVQADPKVFSVSIGPTSSTTGGAVTVGSPSTAQVTIIDNTVVPFSFVTDNVPVPKNANITTVCLQKLGNSAQTISVTVYTTPVTALPAVDFTPVQQVLTFLPSDTVKCVSIPILDNGIAFTGNKTFKVGFNTSSPTVYPKGPTPESTVNIQDQSVVRVSFTAPLYVVQQSRGPATVCIVATPSAAVPITMAVVAGEDPVPSARASTDFSAGSYALTIPANTPPQSPICTTISIVDNQVALQPNKTFTVTLQPPNPRVVVSPPCQVLIVDDHKISVTTITPNGTYPTVPQVCFKSDRNVATSTSVSIVGNIVTVLSTTRTISTYIVFSPNKTVACVDLSNYTDILTVIVNPKPDPNLKPPVPGTDTAMIIIPSTTPTPPPSNGPTVNDTVIGDPLYAVPLLLNISNPLDGPALCYEVHGTANTTFNLVSDTCTSVNAYYSPAFIGSDPIAINVITKIGIVATDSSGVCQWIKVELDGCKAFVNGVQVNTSYQQADIGVRRIGDRVRVSVPNCGNPNLVSWIVCEQTSGVKMIRFVISRGLNLRPSSHGIIGQFWNIPISMVHYSGTLPQGYDSIDPLYIITINPPHSPSRSFLGEQYGRTWDNTKKTCYYSGGAQGGRTGVASPDDSVIEGAYTDYITSDIFSTLFRYNQFQGCSSGSVGCTDGVPAIIQLGQQKFVTTSLLRERWCQAGCNPAKLDELLSVGDIQGEKIEWEKLLAVACTALEKVCILIVPLWCPEVLCEVLSTDSEGGGSRIPLEQFSSLYNYLVIVDGGLSKEKVSAVMQFLSDEAKRYGGKVGPREFTHSKCPRLDAH
ncbi:hypothetical protein EMCRGX_G029850 [Ephydatia muelleri]